jgi:hypothetical protein
MTKTFRIEACLEILNFGHWNLFDICDLGFRLVNEISSMQTHSGRNQSLVLSGRCYYSKFKDDQFFHGLDLISKFSGPFKSQFLRSIFHLFFEIAYNDVNILR